MAFSDFAISVLLAIGPLTGILFGLYTSYINWRDSPFRKVSIPPGPAPNSLLSFTGPELPSSQPWKTYFSWAQTYGNIIYLKSSGKNIVILNALDDAKEMLNGRCAFYSERPKNVMTDLMGWSFNTQLMPYGQDWRGHRKLYQQCFRPKAVVAYRPIQTQKVHRLLYDILNTPVDFRAHCKLATSGVILSLLYGDDLSSEVRDYFMALANQASMAHNDAPLPSSHLVNSMPLLRYLPPWFPGAEFHRLASSVKKATAELLEIPMDFVGKGLLKGTASPSLLVDLLEHCYMQRDFERIKNVATTTYLEGVDTTTSTILSFFLAMARFPDVQKKAQQEIDRAMASTSRLPEFGDRESLPYVEALYREILRWKPPMPLNAAHVAAEADIYNGLHIPKDAMIVANIWAMTRDAEKYRDPESFSPERFLDAEGKLNADDCAYVFGFGRRICPGRHLASEMAWLAIVSVLSVFNIKSNKASNEIDVKYSDGHVSQPLPFPCTITPRNVATANLIRATAKHS